MDWPSQYPDANPIQNVWGIMKTHLAGKPVHDLKQLVRQVRKIWSSLSTSYAEKLVKSWFKACREDARLYSTTMETTRTPTSSANGQTLCANCFSFEHCSCIDEQNKTIFMTWMKKQREESEEGNVKLDKKVSEMSISDKECKQNIGALEKQLNGLSKLILKLRKRRKQQSFFPHQRCFQHRHSQQQLAVNAAEETKPRNVNSTTTMHNQPSATRNN